MAERLHHGENHVGTSRRVASQAAPDSRRHPGCRYHGNGFRRLRGSHDGDSSRFYIGMVLRVGNLLRLPPDNNK